MTATRPVALVTGASRGIGRRTALALAAAGHDVAFTARTVEEGEGRIPPRHGTAAAIPVPGSLARTTAEIEALGVRALPVQMDLLDRTSVQAAAQTVLDAWGRVDVLVNNAVAHIAGTHERFLDLDVDVAQQLATGNYLNQIVLLQAVLPAMLDQGGGTIVNLCSGSATSDPPGPPGEGGWGVAYSASKAAFGRLVRRDQRRIPQERDPGVQPRSRLRRHGRGRGPRRPRLPQGEGLRGDPEQAPAAAVVWLATSPDAQHWLGRVIWTPKLVADLALLR